MKALCWCDSKDVRVENVPEPKILQPTDAIIRVTLAAICGSDLHLYNGWFPTLMKGDILGHETMGEVVEVGSDVRNVKVGDRVVIPFTISCGKCFFCQRELYSLCDNSNPNAYMSEKLAGSPTAGIYGYSHLTGGYAGGQAEYLRVPFADTDCFKVPEELSDEQVLFLSDIFPTGYMAAEHANIQPGDTVAVWGCGPVGQFAIKSAYLLGAERVIAIDRFDYRLRFAEEKNSAVPLNYERVDSVVDALREMTGGLGPDVCIDAVGMESHGTSMGAKADRMMQLARWEVDRPHVLREAIIACRKGGTVSVPGVYGGFVDRFPMGPFMNKGLTLKTGQTHVQKYMAPLLARIRSGEVDPSFVISHRLRLEDAPKGYSVFNNKQDNCLKVVLKP